MDGEFDRDTDDSGWGEEAPVWKTFKEQVCVVRQLVQQTQEEKQAERLIKKMNQKIQEEVEKDGTDEKSRKNVGRWFWLNMNKAKTERELAEEKCKNSGRFKGKFKETRDKAAKNETFWSQMVLIWQGGKHAMFDKPHTTPTNTHTGDKPPPYGLPPPKSATKESSSPTPVGLYPTLDISGGRLRITGLPEQNSPAGGASAPPPQPTPTASFSTVSSGPLSGHISPGNHFSASDCTSKSSTGEEPSLDTHRGLPLDNWNVRQMRERLQQIVDS
ncbi:hypothetical protein AMECASPLE_037960, partial [Ameca splendens]